MTILLGVLVLSQFKVRIRQSDSDFSERCDNLAGGRKWAQPVRTSPLQALDKTLQAGITTKTPPPGALSAKGRRVQ